jgi:hypothetical protein
MSKQLCELSLLKHILKYCLPAMEAVADPTHERPADPLEWNGHDFVRNRFDTAEADRAPAQLSARKSASRKRIKQSRPECPT